MHSNLLYIIIISSLGVFAGHVWLFANGYVYAGDSGGYLPYFIAVDDNIRHGNFPPEWNPNSSEGSGDPLFFWNGFIAYMVEFIHIFENNIFRSIDLVVPVTYVASGLTFFLLAKQITKNTNITLYDVFCFTC